MYWVMVLLVMTLGWAMGWTPIGAGLLYAGLALALVGLAWQRTPPALAGFAITMTLGWFPIFLSMPLTLLVPGALLAVAVLWRRQRTERALT